MKLSAELRLDRSAPAALLLVAAGTLLALVVAAADGPLLGEAWFTQQVQKLPAFLDYVAAVSLANTATFVVLVVGAVAVLVFAARHEFRVAFVLGILLLATPVAQAGIKDLVDRPRPTEEQVEIRTGYTSPSFPAGHLMSPSAVYGFGALWMWRTGRQRLRQGAGAIGAFLLLSCWANVYVGVHWPTDVLGGLLFGGALAFAAAHFAARRGSR